MNLSKFFIDRPIFAGVLSLLILLAGLIALRGLQPGERIVVNGLHRVRPGALLAPQNVPMDAKPEVQQAKRDGGKTQS